MAEGTRLGRGDLGQVLGKLKDWDPLASRRARRRGESESDRARRIPIFCIFFLMLMEGAPVLSLAYYFDADRGTARILFFTLLLAVAWALDKWPPKRYAGRRAGVLVAGGGMTRLTSWEWALAWWLGGFRALVLIPLAAIPSLPLSRVGTWWLDYPEDGLLRELLHRTSWLASSLVLLCLILWLTARYLDTVKVSGPRKGEI